MKQRDKRILFVNEGETRGYYRAELPAKGLFLRGWDARTCNILYETERGTFNGWNPGENSPRPTPRIIVGHVMLTPKKGSKPEVLELEWTSQRDIIEQAKRNGQIFLHDLDDDIWNVPTWNPVYQQPNGIQGHLKEWMDDVNAGDGLICSTATIAQSARENGITVPIWVCENSVDILPGLADRSDHTPLRVGWIGSLKWREPDFYAVLQTLGAFYRQLGPTKMEFWHLGADLQNPDESIREITREHFEFMHVIERPWVEVHQFTKSLTNIDVAIFGGVHNRFNLGRSNCSALSCAVAGVPYVYDEYFREFGIAGLGVISPLTLCDELFRKEVRIQDAAKVTHFSPKQMAVNYESVFTECLT